MRPRVAITPMTSAVPVSAPRIPSTAMSAKTVSVVVATSKETTSTRLTPRRWEALPHRGLQTMRATAAREMVAPICHSCIPMARDSGAMTGLRSIWPVKARRTVDSRRPIWGGAETGSGSAPRVVGEGDGAVEDTDAAFWNGGAGAPRTLERRSSIVNAH